MSKRSFGFSIVELLIAVSILSVLTAIGATVYKGSSDNSQDQARLRDFSAIKQGLELYRHSERSYPKELKDLVKYLDPIPADPEASSGKQYAYSTVPASCTSAKRNCKAYVVCAKKKGDKQIDVPNGCKNLSCAGTSGDCDMGITSDEPYDPLPTPVIALATPTPGPKITTVSTHETHQASMNLAPDGFPILAYQDWNSGEFYVVKCGSNDCASGTTSENKFTTEISARTQGVGVSIVEPKDSKPFVSYTFFQLSPRVVKLRAVRCGDIICSYENANHPLVFDYQNSMHGLNLSTTIGKNDFPFLVSTHLLESGRSIWSSQCKDANCAYSDNQLLASYTSNQDSAFSTVNNNGTIFITYTSPVFNSSSGGIEYQLNLIKCQNDDCSLRTNNIVYHNEILNSITPYSPGLLIPTDGKPLLIIISNSGLGILKCYYPDCSSQDNRNTFRRLNVTAVGEEVSVTLADDGYPIIAFNNGGNLATLKCVDISCNAVSGYTVHDGIQGGLLRIMKGDDGIPVIGYIKSGKLTVLKCQNQSCTN